MDSTRGDPHRRPCGGDTPAKLERNRQALRALARQDGRAVIRQEFPLPWTASGMEARRAETGGGFPPASASGSVHDSPAPAEAGGGGAQSSSDALSTYAAIFRVQGCLDDLWGSDTL